MEPSSNTFMEVGRLCSAWSYVEWLTEQTVWGILVPRHSDFDGLNPGQSSSGRCFGSKSTSMLRATLGRLLIKPARSSVTTIW